MNRTVLEKVAKTYRDDGYDVQIHPSKPELPEFLQAFSPDLLAVRDQERVIVEVKEPTELREDAALAYLAAEVNAHPGWRFDLVVRPSETSTDPVFAASTEPTSDDILLLTDTAERLVSSGELMAACMVAWSAAEAALRQIAMNAGLDLESKTPRYLLNALATEGLLPQSEYSTLNSVYRLRNILAHGLKPASITPDAPEFLIDLTRRIIKPTGAHAAAI